MQAQGGQMDQAAQKTWDKMIRTVVGFLLYLNALPVDGDQMLPVVRPFGGEDPDLGDITGQWEVLPVTSVVQFPDEHLVFLGLQGTPAEQAAVQGKYKLERHGYWRRPSGEGNDPDALRIVHVPPKIVKV